jgi:protein translocase SecG subunit
MTNNVIHLAQLIVAIILIVLILLQPSGQSLSNVFGGSGEFYATRRGFQKKILWLTVFFGFLFIFLAVLNLFFSK